MWKKHRYLSTVRNGAGVASPTVKNTGDQPTGGVRSLTDVSRYPSIPRPNIRGFRSRKIENAVQHEPTISSNTYRDSSAVRFWNMPCGKVSNLLSSKSLC